MIRLREGSPLRRYSVGGRPANTPGVLAKGLHTGPIKPGEDITKALLQAILNDPDIGHKPKNGDVLGITEAVASFGEQNFCTYDDIAADWNAKTGNAEEAVVFIGLPSRNRGSWIDGILKSEHLKKVTLVFRYPRDEQGNSFFDDDQKMYEMLEVVNPNQDVFTYEEFCQKFGKPRHRFTGMDYPEWYMQKCKKADVECQILFCNNYGKVKEYTDCQTYLVGRVHDRDVVAKALREKHGIETVLTLADLMNAPVNGSGYNEEFGLLGCNHKDGESVKLFPRNCKNLVNHVQKVIKHRFHVDVHVMVFGDGAFMDPVGKIWELADPVVSPGYTDGLKGSSAGQAKAKKLIGENPNMSHTELERLIRESAANSRGESDLTEDNALGTTPRRITDLVGSLMDLITGSGDRMTPFVLIRNWFYQPEEENSDVKTSHISCVATISAGVAVAVGVVATAAALYKLFNKK